ncbi:MAG: CCA tRNA nucleotidyltransferase [Clostridium sp.]|uniref:CCA tRNA nucleotidyltransferase n=1 Tax=Clostridium sp. TaxID=1506 RepID=UPI003F3D8CD5
MKIEIPSNVQFIIDTFYNNGFEAFIVGGCIRDSLLGLIPKDYDIATSALPEETIQLFEKTIPTGLQHGTVTVVLENEGFEVTTYRTESTYLNNRCPESVNFVKNIKEDLSRRDFTINSFAYNHKEGLLDFFNGQEDLKNKIIRSVGDSNTRFNEDALRMLRAIRFSSQLNFSIEENTFDSITKNSALISNISYERIRDELSKMLSSDNPKFGIELLLNSGLLLTIIPEFKDCIDFNHNLSILDNTPNIFPVRLAALLYNIGIPNCFSIDNRIEHFYMYHKKNISLCEKILTRLRFDNKTIKDTLILIKEYISILETPSSYEVKQLINRVGVDNIMNLFYLQESYIHSLVDFNLNIHKINKTKELALYILNSNEPLSVKDLDLTGNDLIYELKIKPGKEIGILLSQLLDIVLKQPELNKKELLLNLIPRL